MSDTTEKKTDTRARIKELQIQVDDLKELVNTLLSVIVEEPDGVHTGSAPTSGCLLYTSPSPRDGLISRMPSSA